MVALESTMMGGNAREQRVRQRVTAILAALALHDAPSEQALMNAQQPTSDPRAHQDTVSTLTTKYNLSELAKAPWALGGTGLKRIQLNELR